jgi:hypothetical protein
VFRREAPGAWRLNISSTYTTPCAVRSALDKQFFFYPLMSEFKKLDFICHRVVDGFWRQINMLEKIICFYLHLEIIQIVERQGKQGGFPDAQWPRFLPVFEADDFQKHIIEMIVYFNFLAFKPSIDGLGLRLFEAAAVGFLDEHKLFSDFAGFPRPFGQPRQRIRTAG